MRRVIYLVVMLVVIGGCQCELGEIKCKSNNECPKDMYCGDSGVCEFYPDVGVDIGEDIGKDVYEDVIETCQEFCV
jgi:hypothetical protein